MCTMSMITDYYGDKWQQRRDTLPDFINPDYQPQITQEEIREFRELLERAREYDRQHNQPDCELQEKRDRVKALAEELGVEIDFL